jgi:hypothetical protein
MDYKYFANYYIWDLNFSWLWRCQMQFSVLWYCAASPTFWSNLSHLPSGLNPDYQNYHMFTYDKRNNSTSKNATHDHDQNDNMFIYDTRNGSSSNNTAQMTTTKTVCSNMRQETSSLPRTQHRWQRPKYYILKCDTRNKSTPENIIFLNSLHRFYAIHSISIDYIQ